MNINTPNDLMPLIFPRTSLFRAGLLLLNSKTDPGYKGTLTMGFKNLSEFISKIYKTIFMLNKHPAIT